MGSEMCIRDSMQTVAAVIWPKDELEEDEEQRRAIGGRAGGGERG